MIAIQDVLLSDDIIKEEFVCNLSACKGACCWEGAYGAPVTPEEEKTILENMDHILPYLSLESRQRLEEHGAFAEYDNGRFRGTTLHDNGACTFMIFDDNGTAKCGIEKAHLAGDIDYKKPLSCHMYPIRVTKNPDAGFEAWNYDKWDICSAACSLGKSEQVPIYQFLKQSIIRAKGQYFFDELHEAAQNL